MLQVWPLPGQEDPAPLTDDDLRRLYGYPAELSSAFVRVNLVSSANGAFSVNGRSAGLGSPDDQRVFGTLRELADVILVGAGTAKAEGYRGARTSDRRRLRRTVRGQADVPPVAVVTASAGLDPDGPLFADTVVAPIVLTVERADGAQLARLRDAGAEVYIVGDERAEVARVLQVLQGRGLPRVLCEGGPVLLSQMIRADAVDELCWTIAPSLVAGDEVGFASGPAEAPTVLRTMELATILVGSGGTAMRYRRPPG